MEHGGILVGPIGRFEPKAFRAPPVESDEDEDEDEEAGGAPAAATALGPPPRRLTLRHGRKVPAVKYF